MKTTLAHCPWIEKVFAPFHRLANCNKGLAAVEFALLLPALVAFWLGSVEFGQALTLDRRVTLTASSMADLVAQNDSLSEAQLDDYLAASDSLMQPSLMSYYDTNAFKLVIVNLVKDSDDNLTVQWSREKVGSGGMEASEFPVGSTVLPSQISEDFHPDVVLDNSQQIVAIAEYEYTPTVGQIIKDNFGGSITLRKAFFLAPRKGNVTLESN